jgi:uncharacterized protein (DUF305 family)
MRNITFALAAATLFAGANSVAFGQEHSGQASPLPEQCRQAQGHQPDMNTTEKDMSGLDETHEAYQANRASMMKMHPAMMEGIMAEDPDVAFVCGMIAHHQGAIDMAEVELKYGDNDEAKQMAQEIIDAQTKEIAEFKTWLEANVK